MCPALVWCSQKCSSAEIIDVFIRWLFAVPRWFWISVFRLSFCLSFRRVSSACHFDECLLPVISTSVFCVSFRLSVFCVSFRRASSACHFEERLLPVISTERLLRVISTERSERRNLPSRTTWPKMYRNSSEQFECGWSPIIVPVLQSWSHRL